MNSPELTQNSKVLNVGVYILCVTGFIFFCMCCVRSTCTSQIHTWKGTMYTTYVFYVVQCIYTEHVQVVTLNTRLIVYYTYNIHVQKHSP